MGWIDKVVAELPEEIKPYGEGYLKLWAKKGFTNIEFIAKSISRGDWKTAYIELIEDAPTSWLLDELRRLHVGLKRNLNEEVKNRAARHDFVQNAISVGLTAAMAKAKEEIGYDK